MYVITGATGNTGSRIADALLARGEKVRVIGRNAAGLQRFVKQGGEAAAGNLKEWKFLTGAFAGATAVFAMIPPNYTAGDFRSHQNEIGESIAAAITDAGVRYVVNLSSQGADLAEGTGPILGLRDQEERLNRLTGVNVLHLRPTYFMENLLMSIPLIIERGIAGTAVRGDQPFAMIATRDIADRAVNYLVERNFSGSVVKDLLGERDLTLAEAFAVLGGSIGRPDLVYLQFAYEDAARAMMGSGISPDVTRRMMEMSRALNGGLFAVNRPRTAENTTATSIEAFADAFAEAYAAATLKKAA